MKCTSRNLFVFLTAIYFLLAFSACKNETEFWSTKAEGTISKPQTTNYMYGTHVLQPENSKTFYALMSEEVDLDKYLNKKVEIKGHKMKGYPVGYGPEYIKVMKVK